MNRDLAPVQVYCDFHPEIADECGGQGWIRLYTLDMSDPSQQCPQDLEEFDDTFRACGRAMSGSTQSCDGPELPTQQITYNEVCGRILGYSTGSLLPFVTSDPTVEVGDVYIDGIQLYLEDSIFWEIAHIILVFHCQHLLVLGAFVLHQV